MRCGTPPRPRPAFPRSMTGCPSHRDHRASIDARRADTSPASAVDASRALSESRPAVSPPYRRTRRAAPDPGNAPPDLSQEHAPPPSCRPRWTADLFREIGSRAWRPGASEAHRACPPMTTAPIWGQISANIVRPPPRARPMSSPASPRFGWAGGAAALCLSLRAPSCRR